MTSKDHRNAVLEEPFNSIKDVNENIWQSTCDSNSWTRWFKRSVSCHSFLSCTELWHHDFSSASGSSVSNFKGTLWDIMLGPQFFPCVGIWSCRPLAFPLHWKAENGCCCHAVQPLAHSALQHYGPWAHHWGLCTLKGFSCTMSPLPRGLPTCLQPSLTMSPLPQLNYSGYIWSWTWPGDCLQKKR